MTNEGAITKEICIDLMEGVSFKEGNKTNSIPPILKVGFLLLK